MSARGRIDATATLRTKLAQEQEQVKSLKMKNAALTQKLDSLRKAKATATRVVKGDTVLVDIPGISKANLSKEALAADQEAMAALRAEVARLLALIADLEKRISELECKVIAQAKQLEASAEQLATSEAAVVAERQKRAAAEERSKALDATLCAARKAADLQATELTATKAFLASLGGRCAAAEQKVAAQETLLETAREEQARLRRVIGAGGALAAMSKESEQAQAAELQQSMASEHLLRQQLVRLQQQLRDYGR